MVENKARDEGDENADMNAGEEDPEDTLLAELGLDPDQFTEEEDED